MSFAVPISLAGILLLLLIRTQESVTSLLLRCRTKPWRLLWRRGVEPARTTSEGEAATILMSLEGKQHQARIKEMQQYKDMYFQLHNLEHHPGTLYQSRDLLISLFSETLASAIKRPASGILSVDHYTPESLAKFLVAESDRIARQWEQYLARRRAGGLREVFRGPEEAKWWLKQAAPVKYIDGAWLGHINKITTPFALRGVTKHAWQVFSEELGDGNVNRNHVYVYRELMRAIGAGLPNGDTADFIHPRHELNEPRVWKAAVAQLLISLFPHEFLPEALGFNLQFEAVTLETLLVAKELKELNVDPYYFILHISIDNADSGHTAIASQAVIDYLEHVQKTQGDAASQQAWRRIQAGYILSEGLPTAPERSSPNEEDATMDFPRNEHEAEVIRIMRAKAFAAQKIHCSSRMKIGQRTLADWLEPDNFTSKQWQLEFLDELSKMKPWVRKGDSYNSKLIQELSWEGRMFGSFTQTEVDTLRRWIDNLVDPGPRLYWRFVGRTEISSENAFSQQDICVHHPVFVAHSFDRILSPPGLPVTSLDPTLDPAMRISSVPTMSKLIPLWFAHPCLLESFVSVPSKTTTESASAILRFLRAQSGFEPEVAGVAGMDEVRRTESVGVVELGLEMMKRAGMPECGSLKEVLSHYPSEFALMMLHLSMRPMENAALLLGLAWVFVGLHEAMATADSTVALLSTIGQDVLGHIARRERDNLRVCLEELKDDPTRYASFCKGYHLGRTEIESCIHDE